MFDFISKSAARASPSRILYFCQNHNFSSSLKSLQDPPNQPSFPVNYLINSFGFSPEEALLKAKYFKFENPHKPDSVVELFKNHGFTHTQISSLIKRFPRVLVCDAQKILLPKLEFLKSKGVSSADVARIVSTCPAFLKSSLDNTIIPSFDFLSNLLQSNEKVIAAMQRVNRTWLGLRTRINPNLATLRDLGLSDSSIKFLLLYDPGAFTLSHGRFRQLVEEVHKMGISPSKVQFVVAIRVLRSMTKSTWSKKVDVYRKWGLTEDEIFVAFKKEPIFMTNSEHKINAVMDFFVSKMGWKSWMVARTPVIVAMSLEKRIVPRSAVYQALVLKGFIKTDGISLTTLLFLSEKLFVKRILCYGKEGLKLLNLYKVKLDLPKRLGYGDDVNGGQVKDASLGCQNVTSSCG